MPYVLDAPVHLCNDCALRERCPKEKRWKEVWDICERHLDDIVNEVQDRPRDDENKEYKLALECRPYVQECPYYQSNSQLN